MTPTQRKEVVLSNLLILILAACIPANPSSDELLVGGQPAANPDQSALCSTLLPIDVAEDTTGIELQPDSTDRGDQLVCSLYGEHRGDIVHIELMRDCGDTHDLKSPPADAEADLHNVELREGASWSIKRWNARTMGVHDSCYYELEGTSIDADTAVALLTLAVQSNTPDV